MLRIKTSSFLLFDFFFFYISHILFFPCCFAFLRKLQITHWLRLHFWLCMERARGRWPGFCSRLVTPGVSGATGMVYHLASSMCFASSPDVLWNCLSSHLVPPLAVTLYVSLRKDFRKHLPWGHGIRGLCMGKGAGHLCHFTSIQCLTVQEPHNIYVVWAPSFYVQWVPVVPKAPLWTFRNCGHTNQTAQPQSGKMDSQSQSGYRPTMCF